MPLFLNTFCCGVFLGCLAFAIGGVQLLIAGKGRILSFLDASLIFLFVVALGLGLVIIEDQANILQHIDGYTEWSSYAQNFLKISIITLIICALLTIWNLYHSEFVHIRLAIDKVIHRSSFYAKIVWIGTLPVTIAVAGIYGGEDRSLSLSRAIGLVLGAIVVFVVVELSRRHAVLMREPPVVTLHSQRQNTAPEESKKELTFYPRDWDECIACTLRRSGGMLLLSTPLVLSLSAFSYTWGSLALLAPPLFVGVFIFDSAVLASEEENTTERVVPKDDFVPLPPPSHGTTTYSSDSGSSDTGASNNTQSPSQPPATDRVEEKKTPDQSPAAQQKHLDRLDQQRKKGTWDN